MIHEIIPVLLSSLPLSSFAPLPFVSFLPPSSSSPLPSVDELIRVLLALPSSPHPSCASLPLSSFVPLLVVFYELPEKYFESKEEREREKKKRIPFRPSLIHVLAEAAAVILLEKLQFWVSLLCFRKSLLHPPCSSLDPHYLSAIPQDLLYWVKGCVCHHQKRHQFATPIVPF